jgi:hypothetical protein
MGVTRSKGLKMCNEAGNLLGAPGILGWEPVFRIVAVARFGFGVPMETEVGTRLMTGCC